MLSYLSGYFLKISFATTTASWRAKVWPFLIISAMQTAAVFTLSSILMTIYPIAFIEAPTNSISTSDEYSFNSKSI